MTATGVSPNATISSSNTTVTGAASAHAALSDNSDTSYVEGTSGASDCRVGFSTFTLPAGAVTKSIGASIKAKRGDFPVYARVYYDTAGSYIQVTDVIDDPGVWKKTSSALVPATLTQADIDQAWAQVVTDGSVEGSAVSSVAFDVTYVARPTLNLQTVTDPWTGTNTVPIEWKAIVDADGGVQTRYEIKVFTDVQVGGLNFDPDTTVPYWTSGVVLGSTFFSRTGPLATGTTYHVYVRIAQTVNGAAHWSAWQSDAFLVTNTAVIIDTITATADNASARIQVDVTRDALGGSWEFIEVQRSADAGATWVPVRFADYVDCTGDADDFRVYDWEAGNGQDVIYRARATYLVSGLPIVGEWASTAAAVSWSSASDCWLKSPLDPTLNTTFCMSARDVYSRTRRSGRFEVIGAEAPIVVSDVMGSHSGRLTIETYDATDAADLWALLDSASVLLVQFPASMDIDDFYAAVSGVEEVFVSPRSDNLWRAWSVAYDAVAPPSDPTAGQ